MMDGSHCVFCREPISTERKGVKLTAKGCNGINRASEARDEEIDVLPGQYVHQDCRKTYCNPISLELIQKRKRDSLSPSQPSHSLRSTDAPFDYAKNCIFCGTTDPYEGKRTDYKLIPVRTHDFQEKVIDVCTQRNDDWANKVKARIDFVHDLHAADAVYHQACSVNFRTTKQIPQRYLSQHDNSGKRVKLGRPHDAKQTEAFMEVIRFLEKNDEEQTTISDLIHRMAECLADTDSEPYGFTYMKEQIKQQFGNRIVITEVNGKTNVVTFWSNAATILQDFHSHQKQESPEAEKIRIIQTAAKLIKSDIKSLAQEKNLYPKYEEMASLENACSFLPESLHIFLQGLFTSRDANVKLASLGQAIVQASRPRVILSPLQLGLGVQLHHHFASKFLIDTLYKHGFCCSYSEVTNFERSAAVDRGIEIPNLSPQNFIQYVADNVDHNIRTLDGHNTFHGMGMIATVTPGTCSSRTIPRVSVSAEDIAEVGQVNIEHFRSECDGLRFLHYEKLEEHDVDDTTSNADLLWSISLSLRSSRPAWAGMMQLIHTGDHPGKSSIFFLPMIDMNPSDITCLYSTLLYVSSHAKRYGVTPILTFDQPLWWKAITIQESAPRDSEIRSIVLRLGGFHTEMSYLGAIGHLMAGTGLQELLECIYASNTVSHILSGKAISRATRGHILVCGALNAMLVSHVFDTPVPHTAASHEGNAQVDSDTEEAADATEASTSSESEQSATETAATPPTPDLLIAAGVLYDAVMVESVTLESLQSSQVMRDINQKLMDGKADMHNQLTAKLWLQYLDMVTILQTFVKAERTGNWQLHLQTLYKMLPYLAAAGHNNYTKSVYLYLQNMGRLQERHPEVYQHFQNGLHVGRRSDRYWAGLSQDLLIEQVLMRSIKTTGGLTRGRGMTETQRLVWLLSTNACSEVNLAMQELTSVSYQTSDQHKEIYVARQKKDMTDTNELLSFLTTRSPFHESPALRSIVTGVTCDASVNVECAREVGNKILKSMVGNIVQEYSFKKKEQAVTLSTSSAVKIKDEVIHIDPQLLFQRLVTVGDRTDNLAEIFQYELCSYPPALFENKSTPRLANKASLGDTLWKLMPPDMPVPQGDVQYILDGGAFLHRIPWNRGSAYDEICQQYIRYVDSHYGRPTVVFDGYLSGPSTKDPTQQRRAGILVGATVQFSGSMIFNGRKEDFLSNKENKQRFITLLCDHLERHGCHTEHARADADLLIVQTAIVAAANMPKPTLLVADDTDILVLLCFHSPSTMTNIYLRPEPRVGMKKAPRCWNIAVLRTILGPLVCNHMLFVHAILGCDTTSHIYGLGKGVALKLMRSNQVFPKLADTFRDPNSTQEDVVIAGEHAIVLCYKGQTGDKLDFLRLQRFHQRVLSSTSCVKPEVLPPTSAAAKFHSMRVYLQVQQWIGHADHVKPEDWGWYEKGGKYMPVLTNKDAAPLELLEVVRCGCKMGCSTKQCSCRKHGLDCSTGCGQCRGICSNVTSLDIDEEDNE